MTVNDEIKAGMRRFLAEKGRKVKFRDEEWDDVSAYGWSDFDAVDHIIVAGCSWVIPEGTVVEEHTYSMFDNTFTGNKDEVGLNASGCHCACNKYKNVTLRVTSSLGEAIRSIFGIDSHAQLEL